VRKSYDQLGAALDVVDLTDLRRTVMTAQTEARWRLDAPLLSQSRWSQGTANMEDHETRRKIIREWMALPKDKRQTEEQGAAFGQRRPSKTSSTAVGALHRTA
jgi:hypothetical protein